MALRIAVRREAVDHRAAGITEREHPGDFVVGFAGGVVASAADARVGKSLRRHSRLSDFT